MTLTLLTRAIVERELMLAPTFRAPFDVRMTRLANALLEAWDDVALLRTEVADLTRHAEAMADDLHKIYAFNQLCPPCPCKSPSCLVAAYRRSHPLPPEKP